MVSQPPVTGNQSLDTYLRSVYQELTELETKSRPEDGWSLSDLSTSVSEIIGDKRDLIDIVTKWDGVSADISSWNALIEAQAKQITALSGYMANVDDKAQIFAQVFEWWDQNFHIVLTAKEFSETIENNLASIESAKKAIAASEVNAKTYATNAANSASEAKTSQTAAATSASNAKTSETKAAESLSTVRTDGAKVISDAQAEVTKAAGSASAAETSASQASTSATNAANSASEAKTSQTAAATSASNAKTSETKAADSAGVAETEANRSTTEADRAKSEADKLANSLSAKADVGHKHTSEDISDAVASLTTANAGKVVEVGSDGHIQDNANPTLANHLARKAYVDTKAPATHSHTSSQISDAADTGSSTSAGKVVKWGSSGRIAGLEPTDATHMATKKYVDDATTGIASTGHKHTSADITDSQYVASTANAGKLVRVHTDGHIQDDSAPTVANHLANKGYVDTKAPSVHKHVSADITDSQYVASTANAGKLVRVHTDGHIQDDSAPTAANHLANKAYVDTKAPATHSHTSSQISDAADTGSSTSAGKVVKWGSSGRIAGLEPTDATHMATKKYVDDKVRDAHDGTSIVPTDGNLQEWAARSGIETGISTTAEVGRYYMSKPMSYTISAGEAKFAVDPDIYYYVSFYVRASAANSVMFLELVDSETNSHAVASYSYDNGAVSGETYLLGNYTVPTTWKRLTGRLKFRPGIQSVKFRSFYFNHSNGSVRDANQYISDIQIVPITPGITASEIDTSPYADANEAPSKVLTTGNDGFLHSRTDPTSPRHVVRKAYVDAQITTVRNAIPKIEVVTELPYTRDANTIYMVVG